MSHSIGSVYATYWENIYPDEIEGVIFIDVTELGFNILTKEEYDVDFVDYLDLLICNLGINRLFIDDYLDPLPRHYSEEQQKYSDYLNIKSCENKALLSEIKEKNNNINKAYKSIKFNDIPKIYISSTRGARTIEELKNDLNWISKRKKELGLQTTTTIPTIDKLNEFIKDNIKWQNERLKPYLDLLGNTKIVLISGDHYIFEQKPEILANEIKNLFNN